MENIIVYHSRLPLGMMKGNTSSVFTINGSELTIRTGPYGEYVRYSISNNKNTPGNFYKNQGVQKLYDDLFKYNKVKKEKGSGDDYVQTIFSKGDLQRQNRSGNYVLPTVGKRMPIISVSGHFIRGPYAGRKINEVPMDYIQEIQNTENLNHNEKLELSNVLNKPSEPKKVSSKVVVTNTFKTHTTTGLIMKRGDMKNVYYRNGDKLHNKPIWNGPHGDYTSYRNDKGKWVYIGINKLYKELFGED